MKQWMPEDHGWAECGPSRRSPTPEVDPVRVICKGFPDRFRPAYTPTEVRTIIKRGEEDPRELTPAEQTVANRNRVLAEGDAAAFEKWFRDGCIVPEGNR